MDKIIKRICPLPAELSEIKKNIPCSEAGCNRMFLNSSNLDMHLLKHHKKASKPFGKINSEIKCQYHCPIEKCSYNIKSERFFKNMKYLKQHFLKVHAEKSFSCEKCQKGFSTEAAQKKHLRLCGIKFVCSCSYSYDSYEALITHAKRHQHLFDEKFKSYGRESVTAVNTDDKMINTSLQQDVQTPSGAVTVPVHLLAAVALNEFSNPNFKNFIDKGVQTESKTVDNRRKKGPSPCRERSVRRRTSTHTQTGQLSRAKHSKISTETQTIGDYILKKAMRAANIPVVLEDEKKIGKEMSTVRKRRKSMETQTINCVSSPLHENSTVVLLENKYSSVVDPTINLTTLNNFPSTSYTSLSSNHPNIYPLDIDGLPDLWLGQKNSSSTQTSPISLSALMEHDEMFNNTVTQTDLNLTLFDTESCETSVTTLSCSQSISNLQSYLEDTSDTSFNAVSFEQELVPAACETAIDSLVSLADESVYTSMQIRSLLSQEKKLNFNENRSCSTETQTEIDVNNLLPECDNTSFTMCSNIETQTTEELTSSLDDLLYSNMCTQTCDDILFSDLAFSDIETQTAWPQYAEDSALVSTETQTSLSACRNALNVSYKPWLETKAMSNSSHTETQTHTSEFREIIAELVEQNCNGSLI